MLGLGVNTRVLLVGAHPDDEDTNLIAWLSRGRHVETAYLSLTRGDGGQNIIGNELGEALGVIRTEELLAARRVDGAEQYFTRAFDFGFSKDTADTFRHWPKDTILGDVVRVVRAFRPHVIVAVFSGTPRDGHGHHQVSGILAREAYDVAGDTVRFPTREYGAGWTTPKFYRAARGNAEAGTIGMDVGEYSPLLGESYGEIAGRSRSQHKSQGFGALQRKGPIMTYLRREATRVNDSVTARDEKSLFDGIDTSWARFRGSVADRNALMLLDSLPAVFATVRAAYDPMAPERLIAPLTRARLFVRSVCVPMRTNPCERLERGERGPVRTVLNADLAASLGKAHERITHALQLASGVTIEATSVETWGVGERMPVLVSLYNRGRDTLALSGGMVAGMRPGMSPTRYIAPGGVIRDTLLGKVDSVIQPWWLAGRRNGGTFTLAGSATAENQLGWYPSVWYSVDLGGRSMGEELQFVERVVHRFADDVKGEQRRPVAGVPGISIRLDQDALLAPAATTIDRQFQVHLASALLQDKPREVAVSLKLPAGLRADSGTRTVQLERHDDRRTVSFRVRGSLPVGTHTISARVELDGRAFDSGYVVVDYDHIKPQRVYRPAVTTVTAVDVRVPRTLRVAYVRGVSDNVAPMLEQLGIPVTVIPVADLRRANLSGFTTIVVGPRAYEAHPALAAANQRIFDFARRGGTVVVQYGQYEMTQAGMTPFPVTINRPHDRVTHEDAPVTLLDPNAPELRAPNRITERDFAGWVQERGLYMPRTFDQRYRPLLGMNDPGEAQNRGGDPRGGRRQRPLHLHVARLLPAAARGRARSRATVREPAQRRPVSGYAMTTPTPATQHDASRFRRTLVKVMTVQVITLALLWWLQEKFSFPTP